MKKFTLLFMALLLSFSAWAIPFPLCKREGDVAKYKHLARTLNNDEAALIVAAQRSWDIERIRRGEERGVACPCDNNNPGLKDLITFIESDFLLVQNSLLQQADAAEEQAAQVAATQAQAACQTREFALHKRLLQESKLAYGNNPPAGTERMDGSNVEGLRGFIRTEGNTKTFSFAGSQTPLDWWSNITTKGGSQLQRAMRLHLAAAVSWVKQGKSIQCTGHSLGGGVAEGFCAAVMRSIRQDTANFRDFGDYMKDNRIKVVTFNGLGGSHAFRHAIRGVEGSRDVPAPVGPASWLASNSLHYRVDGDPLAEIIKTPHLMGTVFEKTANRTVTRTGSREMTAIQNATGAFMDTVDDMWRSLWGGRADGASQTVAEQSCRASEDILGAHDLASCDEIMGSNSGWTKSKVAQVEIDARY